MFGNERILGLDIGANTLKVGEFEVTKGQALRLTNFNYADLGLDPEHEENRKALLVATIRNMLKEKGIKHGKVIFSVSGQSVFTRFVKLPPVDESKVVQIIQYEAQQNVPFPINEVVWDYQLVGTNAQGELEVVLLAIKSNIIEELQEGVDSVGLRTTKVDVAPMALYNAMRYNYGDLEGCTVMLDIGARTTNLLFIEKNKIFSRSIPIAGNAISQSVAAEFNIPFNEAEQLKRRVGFVALGGAYEEPEDQAQARVSKIIRNVMTRLHAEVARSVNFYRTQQGGGTPARVFLSGGSSIIPYTDRFFHEKLQVQTEYFNPFRNIEIAPDISKEDLSKCAHFFGEVVGLGLRQLTECPIEVNLLPTTLKSQRQGEQKRPYLAGVAACLLLLPLTWWGYEARIAGLRAQELDAVKTQAQDLDHTKRQIEDEIARIAEIKGKADGITGLVGQRTAWASLLHDINLRQVANLWIVSLSPQTSADSTPAAPKRRLSPGNPTAAPANESGAPANAILTIRIAGEGLHSFQNPARDLEAVEQLANNLRQSPFFDKAGVDIVEPPPAMTEKEIFTFVLRARLATPIKM